MTRPAKTFRNFVMPMLILAPLLWLMAGCFYLPWFEHRTDDGPNIRAVVGPESSNRPIRPGRVTRAQLTALLGLPQFRSLDGTAIGYTNNTSSGYWVWPLCFAAEPSNTRTYAVRLTFGNMDRLKSFERAQSNAGLDWMNSGPGGETSAMMKLDRTGPLMVYVGPGSAPFPSTKP